MQFTILLILLMGCLLSCKNQFDESQTSKSIENSKTAKVNGKSEFEIKKTIMNFMGNGRNFFSRIISIENYINEKKHGTWIYYGDDGSQIKIEEYVNDKLIE